MTVSPAPWISCPKRLGDGTCGGCVGDDAIVIVETTASEYELDGFVIYVIVRDAERVIANHNLQVRRPLVVHKSPMFSMLRHTWVVTATPVPKAVMCPCSAREHELYGRIVWRAIDNGEWCGNPGQPWTSGNGEQHEDGWCEDCITKRCGYCDE